jgi:hypothetical protein
MTARPQLVGGDISLKMGASRFDFSRFPRHSNQL